MSDNVSLVLVSHSPDVARGAADMVRQMVGDEVKVAYCGGNPAGGLAAADLAGKPFNALRNYLRPSRTAKARVLLRPITRLQGIQAHRAAGRWRMHKAPLTHKNTGMTGATPPKNHQIPRPQLAR